jgi:hypothetical protein
VALEAGERVLRERDFHQEQQGDLVVRRRGQRLENSQEDVHVRLARSRGFFHLSIYVC